MSGIVISLPAFWRTFDSYAKPPSRLLTTTVQFTLLSQNSEHNNSAVLNRAETGGNFIQAAKTNQHSGFPHASVKYLLVIKQAVLPQDGIYPPYCKM